MAYAIFRVSKIKSHSSATSKTQHNYRTQLTPNADPDQQDRNQELLNTQHRNYWNLANERIAELGLKRLRGDAVRAVEVLITASPEAFPRDAQGRARDMRDSPWLRDNLDFIQQRFGAKNVVGFALHQDEITPHVHAVIVPVTEDGRLSSRDVFSPKSLRQLQTDYAKRMEPHGLERGVKYSTAIHEDVRRHYGAQLTTQQQLAQVAAPLAHKPFELAEMKLTDRVSPQAYLQREQERMNAHLAEQVAAVNAKLAEVARVATANTLEHERAKVMEQRLANTSQQLEQAKEDLARVQRELAEKNQEVATLKTRFNHLAVRSAQGEPLPPKLSEWVERVQAESQQRAERVTAAVLRQPITSAQQLTESLKQQGFALHNLVVCDEKTQVRFPLAALRPDGQELAAAIKQAIERTQQEQEQARRQALAQEPGALQAVLTARDAEQAGRIQAELEKSGANVWQVCPLADQRVEVRVSYHFNWKTVEGISRVLDKAMRSEGVTVEESYAHRQTRTGAARTAERHREEARTPQRSDPGLGM